MLVVFQFIPGCMVGVELVTEEDLIVFDLFIVRVMIFYNGVPTGSGGP